MKTGLPLEQIWDVDVCTAGLAQLLDEIEEGITAGTTGRTLCCANPHSLVIAHKDPAFLGALCDADILVPDGAGVVLASRLLGGRIRQRVTGSDVMTGIAERSNAHGSRSFFFLGSTQGVLEKIATRMNRLYPRVNVCGTFAPTFTEKFSEAESTRMIEAVNSSSPTVLWVGMTAPKQEKWIHMNRGRFNVPLIAAVGAAFDFFAGTKKRANATLQRIGLEWFPRFLREPRRLWRRNLVSTPVFLFHILEQRRVEARNLSGRH